MKRFAIRMAVLMLCLLTVALSLSSCGLFFELILSDYTDVRTQYNYDSPIYTSERTYRVPWSTDEDSRITFYAPHDSTKSPETARTPVTTRAPETTRRPETTSSPVTAPITSGNIPSEFKYHVYLESVGDGECGEMIGNVTVTVILVNDSVSSWNNSAISNLKSELASQESMLEYDARLYGKKLDITYSYITVSISGKAASGTDNDAWQNDACRAAGLTSLNEAQNVLDARNNADSNAIAFLLNKSGRAYASWATSGNYPERLTVFSSDLASFRHELCHLFGAQDIYYPSSVEALANKHLPESIMCRGGKIDALTAFLIGWDEELDSNAYNFLKETSHLTREYLNSENQKQMYTGNVTDFDLSYGIYTGYVERGVPNGKGKIKYTDGAVYEGDFVNGALHGKGKIKYADGAVYEGDFVNGVLHGKGTIVWTNGNTYTGDWVNGQRTGKGTFTWTDGDVYTGDFVNGTRHGYGKLVWNNGDIYEGNYVNGNREGYGTLYYKDGSVYAGYWKNGNKHGQGTHTYSTGSQYVGEWKEGNRTGYGTMTWSDGSAYTGNWLNNKRHGYGRYVNSYGKVFDGYWENDVFQS